MLKETVDSSTWRPESANLQDAGPSHIAKVARRTYNDRDSHPRGHIQGTEVTADRSTCNSGDQTPTPLSQRNNRSSGVNTSTAVVQDEENGDIDLGCTRQLSPRFDENAGQSIDLVPHMSSAASEPHAQQVGQSSFESPARGGQDWTSNEMTSLTDDASVNFGRLPTHVLSPSVSSGYQIEDGIFEPGSAYQNLFQSLRSQVFRTAQFELEAPNENITSRNLNLSGHDTTHSLAAAVYEHDAATQTFELQPTQEYLLWKAWTEEVSIWVRSHGPEVIAHWLTKTAGQVRSTNTLS